MTEDTRKHLIWGGIAMVGLVLLGGLLWAPASESTRSREAVGPLAWAVHQEADRAADTSEANLPVITVYLGNDSVRAEVARTDEQRQQGLMSRDSLPTGHGMLFIYDRPHRLEFWMKDTTIPLSIAFIDGQGRIVGIQQMEPESETIHRSRYRAIMALEMRQGWFQEHGIRRGDRVGLGEPVGPERGRPPGGMGR